MKVVFEFGDIGRIGEAGALELLLGVITGDIDSVEELLLGDGDGIGEAGAVELLGIITGDIGSVEEPLLGDIGPVEEPLTMGDGCVSTPWISIPPAATGGDGRIGEEGAVELLVVVTCDIKFFWGEIIHARL